MRDWDESQHPRHPRGSSRGGEFRGKTDWASILSDRISKVVFRDEESGTTVFGATITGWKPGHWTEISRLDWEQEQIERIAQTMAEYGVSVEARPDLLENALNDLDPPDQILANGPHRITVYPLPLGPEWRSGWPTKDIAAQVDELLGAFPLIEPLNLALREKMTMSQEGDGASLMGSGMVQLSEKVLSDAPSSPGHFMPQRLLHPYWRYGLVHEWGHMIDIEGKTLSDRRVTGPNSNKRWEDRIRLWKAKRSDDESGAWVGEARRDMSRYGRQNDNEGVAEAFAEWFLSRGQTGNKAAREYAAHYGWDKTWPPK